MAALGMVIDKQSSPPPQTCLAEILACVKRLEAVISSPEKQNETGLEGTTSAKVGNLSDQKPEDSGIETLIEQAANRQLSPVEIDAYWESVSKTGAEQAINNGTLTYRQAQQLGLTSDEEADS
jgi:hypothetical protein